MLIGKYLILSDLMHDDAELAALSAADRAAFYRNEVISVQMPFLVIGLVVLGFALAAALIRFPDRRVEEDEADGAPPPFVAMFRRPHLLAAAVAQFFYVGAQVGIWSYTIRYAQANLPGLAERNAADYLFASLVVFGAGRFADTTLMGVIGPPRLLAGFAAISLVLVTAAAVGGGTAGLYALIAASFFMSIQFPTIVALGMDGLGSLRRAGASLLVMAITGGAVLTGAMEIVSDLARINAATLVPTLSFAVVIVFALRSRSVRTDGAAMPVH